MPSPEVVTVEVGLVPQMPTAEVLEAISRIVPGVDFSAANGTVRFQAARSLAEAVRTELARLNSSGQLARGDRGLTMEITDDRGRDVDVTVPRRFVEG